jgi:hypothetical protein
LFNHARPSKPIDVLIYLNVTKKLASFVIKIIIEMCLMVILTVMTSATVVTLDIDFGVGAENVNREGVSRAA